MPSRAVLETLLSQVHNRYSSASVSTRSASPQVEPTFSSGTERSVALYAIIFAKRGVEVSPRSGLMRRTQRHASSEHASASFLSDPTLGSVDLVCACTFLTHILQPASQPSRVPAYARMKAPIKVSRFDILVSTFLEQVYHLVYK